MLYVELKTFRGLICRSQNTMFMQRDFVLFLYLSWLHLVAQLEMQGLWDKIPLMSPEGVAKQEVTVFDLVVWLHAFDSSSNLLYIFAILYSNEVLYFYVLIAINASSSLDQSTMWTMYLLRQWVSSLSFVQPPKWTPSHYSSLCGQKRLFSKTLPTTNFRMGVYLFQEHFQTIFWYPQTVR